MTLIVGDCYSYKCMSFADVDIMENLLFTFKLLSLCYVHWYY